MLIGHLTYESRPQPRSLVILADLGRWVAVASTSTANDGSFELAEPEGLSSALLVARCAGEFVGAAVAEIALPAGEPVEIQAGAGATAWPVEIEVEGDGDLPDELDLTLIPSSLDGIPDRWLAAAWLPVDGLAHLTWLERRFHRPRSHALVQAGRWSVRAGRAFAVAAQPEDLRHATSWVTVAAEVGGRALEAGPLGFDLEVRGPTEVRLRVEARLSS